MDIRGLWSWASKCLRESQIDNARLDAQLLLMHVLGYSRARFLARMNELVPENLRIEYENLIRKRTERIPVQYLTGVQEFMGLDFAVSPAVLIPRPETEILVESVLSYAQKREQNEFPLCRIADVGTGSGAIAVSLAYFLPNVEVIAIDISNEALQVASLNAKTNGVSKRTKFLQGDLLQPLRKHFAAESFNVIVSNPPYIEADEVRKLQPEVQYEPKRALDGGVDGLDLYRRIIAGCPTVLNKNGLLALEIGFNQGQAVMELARDAGFEKVELIRDLAGLPRVVLCQLLMQ